jgi:hypothetical protein
MNISLRHPSADIIAGSVTDQATGQQFVPIVNGRVAAYDSEEKTFKVATQLVRKSDIWETLALVQGAIWHAPVSIRSTIPSSPARSRRSS